MSESDDWSAEDAAAFARRTIDFWNATGGSDDPMKAAAKVHAEDVLAAVARLNANQPASPAQPNAETEEKS